MRSSYFDWPILICTILLCGIGAAIIASVAPEFFVSQIFFYVLGLGLFFLFSQMDFRIYSSLAKIIYISGLILLGVTLLLGLESHGAIRWIVLGPLRLQFSEILKPLLVVSFASFLIQKPGKSIKQLLIILALAAIPVIFVLKQPDLGSSLVYLITFIVMIFLSDVNLSYIASLGAVFLVLLPFGWHFLADYQKARLLNFLNPNSDPLGTGYNAIQALITVGSGMWFGRGLGHGTQSHLLFLPEKHTDFIFAAIAEELGFIGAAFLLLIYFVLILRIFRLAKNCNSSLGSLICVGIGSLLLVQTTVNIGMNIGLFPVTGITLPLVSYGGSSVLATMIALGIAENVSILSKGEASGTIHN